ncbi:helix-turn-helix domain containing protein [Sphingomonas naphthae]|uniref:Helix-turn-helix domain containing protein n=1 Tax=Sphingomonas naphthae TaxID=1813468 RepID=A0ABY7THJ8_9SPHN|nr:TetR/AcrR family transcriptional regulator [Sphingomonas naphthae]WCT72192.1 helix-turn-helix domain containing protein [Sphingomonas naphthae]
MIEGGDTRSRIKSAAQRLFAERGIEAVTVRQIAAAADARNVGSLSYYFGSKEGLISELVADYFMTVHVRWTEGLDALQRRTSPASVREVVEIIVRARPRAEAGTETALRFMASMLFTRRHMLNLIMSDMRYEVFAGLTDHLRRARPDIPRETMQQRLIFLAWYLVSVLSALEAHHATGRPSDVWDARDPLENIVLTGAAIIEAPIA